MTSKDAMAVNNMTFLMECLLNPDSLVGSQVVSMILACVMALSTLFDADRHALTWVIQTA